MRSSRVLVAALVASAARAVSGAARCPQADRDAPSVKTLLAAPNDTVNTAWVLQPDCKLEILALEPAEDNGAATLNVTYRDIARVESLPSAVERIHLEFNEVKEGDFSSYKSLSHIILAWNNLKTADHFKFPSSLRILDLDSNELTGIAKGVVPDKVETMYIAVNKLDSLANFSLPSSVTVLQMQDNAFTSIASLLPDGLVELHMDSSKQLKAIVNVTMPSSLTTLTCTDCVLQTFRGVQLSAKLTTMDFTGVTLTELEIRESDVSILKSVEFTGDIDQTTCKTSGAALRQVKPTVAACVISDATFEAMYKNGQSQPTVTPASGSTSSDASKTTTPTSDPASSGSSSSSSSSSTTMIIIIVVVACVVCAVAGFLVYRRRARGKNAEPDSDNKYHDATTVEAGGSSAPTVATGSSHVSHSSEYLSNDIRNDEALIAYRIAYEEVELLQVIGKGGFGVVHLGKFRGRDVAVKQMLPDRAKDMRVVRSFMDEIRLCASLEHPRIVEFIGLRWSTLQDVAVINEYMAGGDLHTVLRKQQTSHPAEWFEGSAVLKPKSSLALDVIVALVYLHSFDQPIIHRDLKTRNVLLNSEGDAKLSDFGTSREALMDETMTGEIGTLAWIAPEVLRGERYSEKADIYSLGVLLVELDTASHPYRNPGSTQNGSPISNTRIAMMVSAGKLVPSSSPDCPPDVAAVIASCLTYDPLERPSAMAVHYELRKLFKAHSASGIV